MTIKNVTIGDIFKRKQYKHSTFEVVDFYALTSQVTGEVISYQCIAREYKGLSSNLFEVPFSSVVLGRIEKPLN